jgi:hypothetical protein
VPTASAVRSGGTFGAIFFACHSASPDEVATTMLSGRISSTCDRTFMNGTWWSKPRMVAACTSPSSSAAAFWKPAITGCGVCFRKRPHAREPEEHLEDAGHEHDREHDCHHDAGVARAHEVRVRGDQAVHDDCADEEGRDDPGRVHRRAALAQPDAHQRDDDRGRKSCNHPLPEIGVAQADEGEHAETDRQGNGDEGGDDASGNVSPVIG